MRLLGGEDAASRAPVTPAPIVSKARSRLFLTADSHSSRKSTLFVAYRPALIGVQISGASIRARFFVALFDATFNAVLPSLLLAFRSAFASIIVRTISPVAVDLHHLHLAAILVVWVPPRVECL